MASKTIGIREEIYERLRRYKSDDESFSDAIDRLLDNAAGEWRAVFGTWSGERGDRLAACVERERRRSDADYEEREDEILG